MNSCPSREQLLRYRLDLLDPAARRLIEEHLPVCPACQREMSIEEEIDRELGREMATVLSAEQVLARACVRRAARQLSWRRHILVMAAYAAAAAPAGWGITAILDRLMPALRSGIGPSVNTLVTAVTAQPAIGLLMGVGIVLLTAGTAFAFSANRA